MGATATLAIRIVTDAAGAVAGFNQAGAGAASFSDRLGQAAAVSTAVVAGMAAIGAACVSAASDAQQAAGAVESVFAGASKEVLAYADAAAESVQLSASSYNQLASVLGASLKNLGVSQKDLAGQTNELIELGADLAATFGGPTSDAVAALSSLFRGEMDPIEKYGVSIKQADVNARMAADGLAGLEGEAKKQAETQTRLALLFEQTASAQGQVSRESETLAQQQARMTAEIDNAKVALGEALLPIMAQFAEVLADVAGWISENQTAFIAIAGVVGGLATALIAANAAMTAYEIISGIITAVNAIQAGSWLAVAAGVWAAMWPVLAVIAVIVAVIAVIWLVIANLDTLKSWWDAVWKACEIAVNWCWDALKAVGDWIAGVFNSIVTTVGDVFQKAFDIAKAVVNALLAPIHAVIDAIKSLISWIGNIKWPSMPGWLSKISPFALPVPPGPGGPAPAGTAAGIGRGMGQVTNISITVNGALDPISTGKQIASVIQTSSRGLGISNAVVLSPDRSTY